MFIENYRNKVCYWCEVMADLLFAVEWRKVWYFTKGQDGFQRVCEIHWKGSGV